MLPPLIHLKLRGGSKPPPYPVNCILCVGNGLDRSANRPVYGEVARAKRVTEGQVTSKFACEHSSPLRVGNNLRVVPQNHIKIDGRFVNRPYGWIDNPQFITYYTQKQGGEIPPCCKIQKSKGFFNTPCPNRAYALRACRSKRKYRQSVPARTECSATKCPRLL